MWQAGGLNIGIITRLFAALEMQDGEWTWCTECSNHTRNSMGVEKSSNVLGLRSVLPRTSRTCKWYVILDIGVVAKKISGTQKSLAASAISIKSAEIVGLDWYHNARCFHLRLAALRLRTWLNRLKHVEASSAISWAAQINGEPRRDDLGDCVESDGEVLEYPDVRKLLTRWPQVSWTTQAEKVAVQQFKEFEMLNQHPLAATVSGDRGNFGSKVLSLKKELYHSRARAKSKRNLNNNGTEFRLGALARKTLK